MLHGIALAETSREAAVVVDGDSEHRPYEARRAKSEGAISPEYVGVPVKCGDPPVPAEQTSVTSLPPGRRILLDQNQSEGT